METKMEYVIDDKWVVVYVESMGKYVFAGKIEDRHMSTQLTVEMFDTEEEMNARIDELGLETMFVM